MPWQNINLHDGVNVGFYGGSPYDQVVIVEGELIQIASEKRFSPSDQSSFMASSGSASLGNQEEKEVS